jgi:kynureninase
LIFKNSKLFANELDQNDPLKPYRDQFYYPKDENGEEVLYLCGNSLGLQPKSVRSFVEMELNVWEKDGVLGQHGRWEKFHEKLMANSARLVGAIPSEVVVMNALTVNINLLLISFYQPTKNRHKIIIEKGAFPSDQYAVESHFHLHGYDPKDSLIELTPRTGETTLRTDDIVNTINDVGEELATIIMGGVNYYTGQAFDMETITKAGKSVGAFVGFDLAHAAGNIDLNLHDWNVDFAAWCTYKYLCAGPGAPSGIFVNKKHHHWTGPRLVGWWGQNKQTRFDMGPDFDPIKTVEGWQISNAPVLGMAPLLASMQIYDDVGMIAICDKSKIMTGYMEFLLKENLPEINIITPNDPNQRGCQLSLVIPGGKAIFESISQKGVVCDWREPNVIRVAPHPLYNQYSEVYNFVQIILHTILG